MGGLVEVLFSFTAAYALADLTEKILWSLNARSRKGDAQETGKKVSLRKSSR